MASATTSTKMREEATCPICLQLMAEPMSISCGHSYCQACLLSFMGPASSLLTQQDTETFSCPQCRAPFQRGSLRPSKQLGNLIAALRELELELEQKQEQKEEQELFCQEHGERLLLFCEEDGQLICWRCDRGLRHKGHATSLVEDAGPGYQEKLQEAVRKLRQLEEECASQKAFTAKQIAEWNEKIETRSQKIQEDFQNLHRCLSEEKRYLQILESKKEHTLRKLREREAKLEQQSRDLESRILELEERCQGSAQKMLQGVKAALSRSQAVWLETQEVLSLEVQIECDVPELYFDLRKWLRNYQGPCEDGLPLSLLVWDFLNHLTGLPGSHETDMEQFAKTLCGRVTTDEALEELVDVLYEQATSVPRFRGVGAHLCYYLSFHPTVSSPRSNFSQVFSQRLQTEHDLRYQAAKGDEATRKRFHGFVLFLGELYLWVKIEGAQAQGTAAHLRGLLDVLLSNPVDDNLVCAVQLLNVTGPMKEQGKKDMEEVIQRVVNVALDAPCSADVRQMVLEFVQLWSSNWGKHPIILSPLYPAVGVTLDPETAHLELILSKDQRQVMQGGCPQGARDASLRRFTVSPSILGFMSWRQYFKVDVGESMGWDLGVCLILSKDQRQVTRRGRPQGAGDPSPQRFTVSTSILGFMSWRQYFEVDVGEGVGWDVGVCLESVQRLVETLQKPEAGFWALQLCARDGYQALTWPCTPLGLEKPPLAVGVLVDCEVGVVSFYNATSGSHLFTFPRASFPGVLRPYFQVSPCSPLFLPSLDE